MSQSLAKLAACCLILSGSAFAQTFSTIYSFPADGSMGKGPEATLTVGPDAQLYGAAVKGGANDHGAVFKVSTDGGVSMLGSLQDTTTGRFPFARLASPGDGFLYGATERNDTAGGAPLGTVFKVNPAGGLSVVYQFPGGGTGPKLPHALVATDSATLQVLGSSPGGLWNVTTGGSATNTYTFGTTAADGVFPFSLIRGSDGKLYGTTEGIGYVGTDPGLRGTLFRINANGTGMTKLHDCLYETGVAPRGAMVEAGDGSFYGTMSAGGANARGVIFQLTPGGTYTVIYHFDGLQTPQGDLLLATDGYLYGTTSSGGPNNYGGVFRIKPDGTGYKVIQTFLGPNGSRPRGGLVQANDGNLYGTTSEGGASNVGTIFRVGLDLPPPNRAPVALDDIGVTSGDAISIDVLGNDFDPESGQLTVTAVSTPSHGTVTIVSGNSIDYDPAIGFAGTDSFTYTVSDSQGLTATATVAIQSTPVTNVVYSGGYNGLLNYDPELAGNADFPRAQIFVAINEFGGFTGFLVTKRKKVPFRGAFDLEEGTAAVKVTLPNKKKATVFLGFRQDEEATLLAVVFGREVWSGSARPYAQSGLTTTERQTVVMVSQGSGMPDGFGYGVMQIKPSGLVTCVGKHGDGTKLTWATTLVLDTDGMTKLIPVFAEPVTGGVCAGVLDPRANPVDYDFAGRLRWIRPPGRKATLPYASGFTGETAAGASHYTPRPPNGTLDMAFSLVGDGIGVAFIADGPLAAPIGAPWSFAPTRVAVTDPLKQLVFNQKTGFVSGKMRNGTSTVSFSGIVNQPGNFGAGLFLINSVAGRFELNP